MPNTKRPKGRCLHCGEEPARSWYTYCGNVCQLAYQHQLYIQEWQEGKLRGLSKQGVVSTHIKRYLREKYKNKCILCGWSEINKKTGQVPLVADHIDGNWRNNKESNLRLICPNCDSLSSTYAALNKGNGRKNRAISNRVKEAHLLIKKL